MKIWTVSEKLRQQVQLNVSLDEVSAFEDRMLIAALSHLPLVLLSALVFVLADLVTHGSTLCCRISCIAT